MEGFVVGTLLPAMVSRELPIAVAGRAVVDHDANSNAGPLTKDSVLDNDDARTPSMSG